VRWLTNGEILDVNRRNDFVAATRMIYDQELRVFYPMFQWFAAKKSGSLIGKENHEQKRWIQLLKEIPEIGANASIAIYQLHCLDSSKRYQLSFAKIGSEIFK
jgi:hypothetical protein